MGEGLESAQRLKGAPTLDEVERHQGGYPKESPTGGASGSLRRTSLSGGHALQSNYKIDYHGAPDNYIVTATDDGGASASFELSWTDAKWRLILGTAGKPQSPAATAIPAS